MVLMAAVTTKTATEAAISLKKEKSHEHRKNEEVKDLTKKFTKSARVDEKNHIVNEFNQLKPESMILVTRMFGRLFVISNWTSDQHFYK